MRDDRLRLNDIEEAISRIKKYAAQGQEAFLRDELIQTWIVHHLQIIGEACRALSLEYRDRHPEVPWAQIIGMRHILVHHYFGIDHALVWSAVTDDLSMLEAQISGLLNAPGAGGEEKPGISD